MLDWKIILILELDVVGLVLVGTADSATHAPYQSSREQKEDAVLVFYAKMRQFHLHPAAISLTRVF